MKSSSSRQSTPNRDSEMRHSSSDNHVYIYGNRSSNSGRNYNPYDDDRRGMNVNHPTGRNQYSSWENRYGNSNYYRDHEDYSRDSDRNRGYSDQRRDDDHRRNYDNERYPDYRRQHPQSERSGRQSYHQPFGTRYEKQSFGSYRTRPSGKDDEGLRKLLTEQLKDMYWAEKALSKALPKMIQKASSQELKNGIREHLGVTKDQISKLEEAFGLLGLKATAKKCEAMSGLIDEAEEIIKDMEDGPVRDAGIICAAQKVEHYEIATYGCLATYADTLDEQELSDLLNEILEEEKEADQKLSQVAYSINWEAKEEGEEEDEDEEDDDEEDEDEEDDDEDTAIVGTEKTSAPASKKTKI